MENEMTFLALLLGGAALSILFLGACFYYILVVRKKQKCTALTQGVVTGRSLSGDSGLPAPIVEYEVDGVVYKRRNAAVKGTRVAKDSRITYKVGYEIGDTVDVHYDPAKPERWMMNDNSAYKMTALIPLIMGAVLLFSSMGLYIIGS